MLRPKWCVDKSHFYTIPYLSLGFTRYLSYLMLQSLGRMRQYVVPVSQTKHLENWGPRDDVDWSLWGWNLQEKLGEVRVPWHTPPPLRSPPDLTLIMVNIVVKTIINHHPNHHFHGWYKPSNMGWFIVLPTLLWANPAANPQQWKNDFCSKWCVNTFGISAGPLRACAM